MSTADGRSTTCTKGPEPRAHPVTQTVTVVPVTETKPHRSCSTGCQRSQTIPSTTAATVHSARKINHPRLTQSSHRPRAARPGPGSHHGTTGFISSIVVSEAAVDHDLVAGGPGLLEARTEGQSKALVELGEQVPVPI